MQKKLVTFVTVLALSSSLLLGKNLVTVNGHTITDAIIPPGYEKLDDTKRNNLMEQLIREEVLHANLLKSSIVKDSEFTTAFEKQKKQAQEQYKKSTGKDLNKEQIRSIKGSIAVALYQQKEFKKTKVSAAEVKAFYDNNQKTFDLPDSIEIADIIVKTKSEADTILKSLQSATNLDEAFIKAAQAQKQNGYMGWFGKGTAPQNLFDVAYKAKVKTLLATPIKTKHGYNVVYLLNKKPAAKLPFSQAKDRIEQMLKQKKVIETLQNKVETLYGQAKIVY
ncbi:peptidyl-prolyl cis-trans isomerase [bacterium]|nr:peptidyl-prolyl cis-trans isomerase [bacterium]MBU1958412.1 peptidyl-prolyl cis-trans isomerase [bacterium]